MDHRTLEQLRKRLSNHLPFVGVTVRRAAARRLASDPTVESVSLLAEALADDDRAVRATAERALSALRDAAAIDRLCALWAERETRPEALGAVLRAQRFVAREPVTVRVLSSLEVGAPLDDAEAVPEIVTALADCDARMRRHAEAALKALRDPAAVDALCAIWAATRAEALAAIVRAQRFVARKPGRTWVLSALLAGAPLDDPEAVPHLVAALDDPDASVGASAAAAVKALRARDSIDALCAHALADPDGKAARLCASAGWRPSDPEEACLFLFVTRQLDEYFQEDHDFELLRLAYERASDQVRARVMSIVRSGDRRCLGFFGPRKPLSECSGREISLAIEAAIAHKDWPRLFRAALDLPLRHGMAAFRALAHTRWEPDQPELRSLHRALMNEMRGGSAENAPRCVPSVIDRWLAEGGTGPLAAMSEQELVQRLGRVAPPEGVRIVGALAKGASARGAAARAILANPHWIIRLAGYATGLCWADLSREEASDDNHWVGELAAAASFIGLWPPKADPADLERLNSAPSEVSAGRLGTARRMLRLLLAHRTTAPEMTECVVDAGEFAGEFEEIHEAQP